MGAKFAAECKDGAQVDLDDLITIILAPCRGLMLSNENTHLIPILIRELLTRMSPLNPSAVQKDLRLDALTC